MKRSNLLSVAVLGLLACAGAAFANAPDLHVAAQHFFANHGDFALAFGPALLALQGKQAAITQSMGDLLKVAEAEDRDLTEDEQNTFDAGKTELEAVKARIERQKAQALAEAGIAASTPPTRTTVAVDVGAAQRLSVSENVEGDPKRGFASFGDLARSVHAATMSKRTGQAVDRRLVIGASAPGTYSGEASGVDGGFLIPPGFSSDIFTLSLTDGALLPYTDEMNIDGNSMAIPKDETTPWGTTGVRAFWQGEATAAVATKPVLGLMDLRLKKLMALVPVSDEIASDTSALNSYLPKKMASSVQWKANEAILFGLGAGQPQGAMVSGAVQTIAKESGQATLTLQPVNLAKMVAALPPGSYPNAIWIINNDVLPYLFTMTLGNYPIYLPGGAPVAGGIQANPYGMLLGRPIMISQHAKSFSSQGDVLLVDLTYYQTITKAEGIQTATSMHLYFDADAMAFRTTFRMDGQSKIAAPITPANGSNNLSPFVQLGAR